MEASKQERSLISWRVGIAWSNPRRVLLNSMPSYWNVSCCLPSCQMGSQYDQLSDIYPQKYQLEQCYKMYISC